MDITKIYIENFKGIGKRVELSFSPLMLLFGANSAGKSSIIHALHYIREIFCEYHLSPDHIKTGADVINLGGFPNFVHNQDLNNDIKIGLQISEKGIVYDFYEIRSAMYLYYDEAAANFGRSEFWRNIPIPPSIKDMIIFYPTLPSLNYILEKHWGFFKMDYGPSKAERKMTKHIDKTYSKHPNIGTWIELVIGYDFERKTTYTKELILKDSIGMICKFTLTTENKLKVELASQHPIYWYAWIDNRMSFCIFESLKVLKRYYKIEKNKWIFTANIPEEYSGNRNIIEILEYFFDKADHSCTNVYTWGENWQGDLKLLIPLEETERARWLMKKRSELFKNPQSSDYEEVDAEYKQYSDADTRLKHAVNALSLFHICCFRILTHKIFHDFRYIGPVREKPDRNYIAPNYISNSRWANGLAGWDMICLADKSFVNKINQKLKTLEAGYQLTVKDTFLIPEEKLQLFVSAKSFNKIKDELSKLNIKKTIRIVPTDYKKKRKTGNNELLLTPNDVGEGVSQVLPILAANLDDSKCILIIEQPELHLHPKQQAGLGDIIIEGIRSGKKLLIETHSEHLILRILRRIRESSKSKKSIIRPTDLSVIYVERKNGQVEIFDMEIDDKGEFITPWPDNFFEQDFIERFGRDA